jgi:hypothetical protein
MVNGDVIAQGSQFSMKDVEVVTACVDLDNVSLFFCSDHVIPVDNFLLFFYVILGLKVLRGPNLGCAYCKTRFLLSYPILTHCLMLWLHSCVSRRLLLGFGKRMNMLMEFSFMQLAGFRIQRYNQQFERTS